jgi:hypothetical protein
VFGHDYFLYRLEIHILGNITRLIQLGLCDLLFYSVLWEMTPPLITVQTYSKNFMPLVVPPEEALIASCAKAEVALIIAHLTV